jgi:Zn finger protein HypA/HybF involved in hydrogenase expression
VPLVAKTRDGAQCPNDPGPFPLGGTNVPSRA